MIRTPGLYLITEDGKEINSDEFSIDKDSNIISINKAVFKKHKLYSVGITALGYNTKNVNVNIVSKGNYLPKAWSINIYGSDRDTETGSIEANGAYGLDVDFKKTVQSNWDNVAEFWSMQAKKENIVTEADKRYILTFDADLEYIRSSSAVRGMVLEDGSASKGNKQQTIDIKPGKGTYTLTMTPGANDDFYLLFMPGGTDFDVAEHTLKISNIRFIDEDNKDTEFIDEPDIPDEPETPVEPEKPSEPEKPETPAEPDKPSEPETPIEPEKPTEPEKPSEPEKPTEPEKPSEPVNPTEPARPTQPSGPSIPPASEPSGEVTSPSTGDNTVVTVPSEPVATVSAPEEINITDDGKTPASTANTDNTSDDTEENVTSASALTLKITGISHKIAAGKKIKLSVSDKKAKITWKSSNKKYATVNTKGEVTLKKAGIGKTVTIKATSEDGRIASYKINIMKYAVTKITLKTDKTSVTAGKKVKLTAKVLPSKASVNKKLLYKSGNKTYATVNSNGVVTTKKAGKGKTVTIRAYATDGSGKKATIKIKIK